MVANFVGQSCVVYAHRYIASHNVSEKESAAIPTIATSTSDQKGMDSANIAPHLYH